MLAASGAGPAATPDQLGPVGMRLQHAGERIELQLTTPQGILQ